ncbi:TetR/AcrR family transcriptional regulator [Leifsonia sp. A12D58]|uniref:TetR/AcrR family transcriptional regulator n=1 Tax=Leifsonia sp. A12D58 TaxID=3397674 RepID=UPI0039E19186
MHRDDPRAIRSRVALVSAITDLLETREASEISITDVVGAAGVSRPTFYQHFTDLPDLVAVAAITGLEASFARSDARFAGVAGVPFLRGSVEMLVDELYARRTFYRQTLQGASSRAVSASAIRYVEKRMRDHVVGTHLGTAADIDDQFMAIAAGATWLIISWLGSDFEGRNAPPEMTRRLTGLVAALTGIPGEDAGA